MDLEGMTVKPNRSREVHLEQRITSVDLPAGASDDLVIRDDHDRRPPDP
jgi:hypothetical protein